MIVFEMLWTYWSLDLSLRGFLMFQKRLCNFEYFRNLIIMKLVQKSTTYDNFISINPTLLSRSQLVTPSVHRFLSWIFSLKHVTNIFVNITKKYCLVKVHKLLWTCFHFEVLGTSKSTSTGNIGQWKLLMHCKCD